MCHECGKPEPQCECEGEEHGVKDGHDEEKKIEYDMKIVMKVKVRSWSSFVLNSEV